MKNHAAVLPVLLILAWISSAHAQVELERIISISTSVDSLPGVRFINPQGFSVGADGSVVAAGRLTGPGISPQDGNDTVLAYKGPGENDKIEIALREGQSAGTGTVYRATQATIDSNGNIAVLAEIQDAEIAFLRRPAVFFGAPHALSVLEFDGRMVNRDGVDQQLGLEPRLRHSPSGAVAYKIDIGSYQAIMKGSPPGVPMEAVLETGKSYSGLPTGAMLASIDNDFLMNPSGIVAFTGSYCIPSVNPNDPPQCFPGIFTWDGLAIRTIALEGATPYIAFSLWGHSFGENGHITFSGRQPGVIGTVILQHAPREALAVVDIPGLTIARTGVGFDGTVLIWAFDPSKDPIDDDSVWLWNRSDPQLLVQEDETDMPYFGVQTRKFRAFTNAAIGPGNRIAIQGGSSVWMTDDDGNLQFVKQFETELPPFELDINNFVNGLGNGADGRHSVFFNDGSLLVRVDASVRVARVVPPVPPLDGKVAISMHRMTSAANDSFALGNTDPNAPLVPRPFRQTLDNAPVVGKGMVADGVTPLIFRVEKSNVNELLEGPFTLRVKVVGGGKIAGHPSGDLTPKLIRFDEPNGKWKTPGNTATFSIDGVNEPLYFYLSGIRSDDLQLENSVEVEVEVTITPTNAPGEVFGRQKFLIRKPPVMLIHGYNTKGDWGQGFFSTLAKTRALRPEAETSDNFVIETKYGQVQTGNLRQDYSLENTVLPLNALAGQADQAFREALEPLKKNWAIVRHDVVGHSQGGLLARMLCSKAPPPEFVPNPFRSVHDFNRGRFHRVITIGSPHNGSRLVRYINALGEKRYTLTRYLGATARSIWNMTWFGANEEVEVSPYYGYGVFLGGVSTTGIVQEKFDPTSEQIRDLNNPSGPWVPDPSARFHLVRTTINGGDPPNSKRSAWGDYLLGLGSGVGPIVLPRGSDGVVDWHSMGAHGEFDEHGEPKAPPANVFTLDPMLPVSHSGPEPLFSVRKPPEAIGQVNSLDVAAHVLAALDQDSAVPAKDRVFDSFHIPPPLSTEQVAAITSAATEITIVEKGGLASAPGRLVRDGSQSFEIVASPDPSLPISDGLRWNFEARGTDETSTFGISWVVDPDDSLKVTVEVDDTVVGDVIGMAAYRSTGGELVLLESYLVTTCEPDGVTISGLELFPDDVEVAAGFSLFPSAFLRYDNGTSREKFLDESASATSSDSTIVRINHINQWEAVSTGTATVTVNVDGLTAATTIEVIDPFPPLDFESWRALFFSESELADESVSGKSVDIDGDGLDLFFEYITGGHPLRAASDHLPHLTTVEVDGVLHAAISVHVSQQLVGQTVVAQRSSDLRNWEDLFILSGNPEFSDSVVLDYKDAASHFEFFLDAVGSDANYYRLAVSPNSETGTTELIFDIAGTGNFSSIDQGYGDRVTTEVMGNFTYGGSGGFTPNVEVSYGPERAQPTLWTTGYGDLSNILFEDLDNFGILEVTLTADPGYQVSLHRWDMAVFSGDFAQDPVIDRVQVLDEQGNALFDQEMVTISKTTRTQFDHTAAPLTASTIVLRFESGNLGSLSDDVALDNIVFSQSR